jgi:transketolase N-terminal domain/subunit
MHVGPQSRRNSTSLPPLIAQRSTAAGHYKLENLTVLADVNALGQSEPTMYQHNMEIYRQKFESEDWAVQIIEGHDVPAVIAALDRAKATKGTRERSWRGRSRDTE